jgi:hypothetical protein
MEIKRTIKNGRKIIYGKGSYEEVESLNIEKDFETALNVLGKIRDTRKNFFNDQEPGLMNRTLYGRRKYFGRDTDSKDLKRLKK